jgi:hypothetical protein
MATRSRIGIQLTDGSVLSVYHHWDGYPKWLGKTLQEHYNSYEEVSELIDGGDMSSCWTDERWSPEGDYNVDDCGPQYYSDRQDRVCEPRLDSDLNEYLSNSEEYSYLFANGQWVCYDHHYGSPRQVQIPVGVIA